MRDEEILREFISWYNGKEMLLQEIINKVNDIHLFDLNLDNITDTELLDSLNTILSGFNGSVKARLLDENKNAVQFLQKYVDRDHLLHWVENYFTMLNEGYFLDGIRALEIIRDFLYINDDLVNEMIRNTLRDEIDLNIKEEDSVKAGELLKEIIYKDEADSWIDEQYDYRRHPIGIFNWGNLSKSIIDDDVKIDCVMYYIEQTKDKSNGEAFLTLIHSINNFDKRVELIKRMVSFCKEKNVDFIPNYVVSAIFYEIKANSKEEVNHVFDTIKELSNDEFFSQKRIGSNCIDRAFSTIQSNDLFFTTLDEVKKDPFFSQIFDEDSKGYLMMNVLKTPCITDDRKRLEVLKDNMSGMEMYSIDSVLKIVKDKELLLDYDLMKDIYSHLSMSNSIAYLYFNDSSYSSYNYDSDKAFLADEKKHKSEGTLDELLNKYKRIGPIDDKTLEEVYDIASKTIKNLTMEDMINRIEKSGNAKEILQYISTHKSGVHVLARDGVPVASGKYSDNRVDKFAELFPKTRFGAFPDLASFEKMDLGLCEKFKLKTWNELIQNPVFGNDDNSKRALVEVIAMAGLFEDDPMVDARKRQILKIFNSYDKDLTSKELSEIFNKDPKDCADIFDESYIQKNVLRDGVEIPDNLSSWLKPDLTETQMSRIKKQTGAVGSQLTKFISPYVKVDGGYKVKNRVNLEPYKDYLGDFIPDDVYEEWVNRDDPNSITNFLAPYKKVNVPVYNLKQNIDKKPLQSQILNKQSLKGRYTHENIHRMFDGLNLSFDPAFYDFFIEHQDQILEDYENYGHLKDVKNGFESIKKYYSYRGNQNPSYKEMVSCLNEVPYIDIEFGNEEFAKEAKSTQVSQKGFSFYQELLKETRNRHLTTIPRHDTSYEYTDPNTGEKYEVIAKILRADDPFNMLVGEASFTDCCQVYNNAGQACMEHAAKSKDGGIFTTYLMKDGVPNMLTQSWIWSNEGHVCLDNVEGTDLVKEGDNYKLYQDIARYAIKCSADDMIKSSKMAVDAYIKEETDKINNSQMSDAEKEEQLNKLKEIQERQTIRLVTVGESCDDINVTKSFKTALDVKDSYGPKGYDGYRDSTGAYGKKQYIVSETETKPLIMDPHFEDVPIYRDERRVQYETGSNVRYETLRKITDIDYYSNNDKKKYINDSNEYAIREPGLLADFYDVYPREIRIVHGEDWYFIFADEDYEIVVYDFGKANPRLEDESNEQAEEIMEAFEEILFESVKEKDNGELNYVKPIEIKCNSESFNELCKEILDNDTYITDDGSIRLTDEKIREALFSKNEIVNKGRSI